MGVIPITVYFPVCDRCGWSPDDVGVGCARPEDADDILDQHDQDRHEGNARDLVAEAEAGSASDHG